MNEESAWFYELSEQRMGPVTEGEIRALLDSGTIHRGTLVWKEGMADWMALSATELAPLAGTPPAGPPPIPPNRAVLVPVAPPRLPPKPFVPRAARLRPDFRPSLSHCFGRAWDLMAKDFWPYVGMFALMAIMLGFATQLYIPILFLVYPMMGGLYWYILLRKRGRPATIDALFEGFRRGFGALAVTNLILMGVMLGSILLLFGLFFGGAFLLDSSTDILDNPGESTAATIAVWGGAAVLTILLTLFYLLLLALGHFATILILDCGCTAGEALFLAWMATKRRWFSLCVFFFVSNFVSVLGVIALYFGVYITGAWSSVASVYLYEQAFGDDPDQGAIV